MQVTTKNILNWNLVSEKIDIDIYKHFSFDFWNTIAYSNPEFKQKRSELICQYLGNSISFDFINSAFEKIGKDYNTLMESGSKIKPPEELLFSVAKELGIENKLTLELLSAEIDLLFLQYPPVIEQGFVEFLNKVLLVNKTCSITSNTAFISGATIKKFLVNNNLLDCFKFTLFSDEVGFGKPHNKIFNLLYANTKQYYDFIDFNEVCHIGDNYLADFCGAITNSVSAYHIEYLDYLSIPRYAVHVISNKEDLAINPKEYSEFKFGDADIAKKYGEELFKYFVEELFDKYCKNKQEVIIYSSPFAYIPTASYYLTQNFFNLLTNYSKSKIGFGLDLKINKINRCQTYAEDYGAMDAKHRFDLIKNDTYDFECAPSNDSLLIFIDDISITGTHQRVVERLMSEKGYKNDCVFLYYAKLVNFSIPPNIENDLNYAQVNSLHSFIELIRKETFLFTTRGIKFMLKLPTNEFTLLIEKIMKIRGKEFLIKIYKYSLNNNYNKIDLYRNNIEKLYTFIG